MIGEIAASRDHLLEARDELGHLSEEAHVPGVGDGHGGGARGEVGAEVEVVLRAELEPAEAALLPLEEGSHVVRRHPGAVGESERGRQLLHQVAQLTEREGEERGPAVPRAACVPFVAGVDCRPDLAGEVDEKAGVEVGDSRIRWRLRPHPHQLPALQIGRHLYPAAHPCFPQLTIEELPCHHSLGNGHVIVLVVSNWDHSLLTSFGY